MSQALLETLPLEQRLALSYAPASSRRACLALLALDRRLANILRGSSEPMMAQIKLAWWRERLSEDPAKWPSGEPLLAELQKWPGGRGPIGLVALVNGWEMLLSDEVDDNATLEFAQGRALSWQALAEAIGAREPENIGAAAKFWALADLSLHLGGEEERAMVRQLALKHDAGYSRLDRRLRPLAVLNGLSRRAMARSSKTLFDERGAALLAFRLGMLGG